MQICMFVSLFGMHVHVLLQVPSLGEVLSADLADIWSFSGVMATVVDERPLVRTFFSALFVGAKELRLDTLSFRRMDFQDLELESEKAFLPLLLLWHVHDDGVLVDLRALRQ